MRGNTIEGIKVDIMHEMRVYDALPAYIRELFQNAVFEYAVIPIAKLYIQMANNGNSREYIQYEISKLLKD